MNVSEVSVEKMLKVDRYTIPAYQRPYKWDAENVKQLLDDIEESCRETNESEYFIGSIICISKGNGMYEVVDGQQRLITLSLILLGLAECADIPEDAHELKRMVMRRAIGSDGSSAVPVVKVRKPESSFYEQSIISGQEAVNLSVNQKVFVNNRDIITEKLSDMKNQRDKLQRFLQYFLHKVKIILVQVDDNMSAFRLFNVLNNRGIPLSDADLVKNHLLSMAADGEETSEKIEEKWLRIENLSGADSLNEFLSLQQIAEKTDRDRVNKRNYDYYAAKSADAKSAVELADSFCQSAERREAYRNGDMGAKRTIDFLILLSRPKEWEPAFMAFLGKEYAPEQFSEFAALFEKVYMHYLIAREGKSSRDKICYSAVEVINKNGSFGDVMARLRELKRNDLLDESLDRSDFYDESRPVIINLVKSALVRLNAEQIDKAAQIVYPAIRKITVEHILPKKMKHDYWTRRFSEQDHEEWRHKLGNLTLLSGSKNSSAGARDFEQKKAVYQKAKPFHATTELCKLSEWDMDALKARHEKLKAEIKALWTVE